MKSLPNPKPFSFLSKYLIPVFLAVTVLCAVPPGTTAQAKTLNELIKMPDSTQGGLTVTWYSAKRFSTTTITQGSDMDGVANLINFTKSNSSSTSKVDLNASIAAFDSFDRSVSGGTTYIGPHLRYDKMGMGG